MPNKPMLLAANWTGVASTRGRGSAATGLTPFVVAAGRRILTGLALQQIGRALGRLSYWRGGSGISKNSSLCFPSGPGSCIFEKMTPNEKLKRDLVAVLADEVMIVGDAAVDRMVTQTLTQATPPEELVPEGGDSFGVAEVAQVIVAALGVLKAVYEFRALSEKNRVAEGEAVAEALKEGKAVSIEALSREQLMMLIREAMAEREA